MSAHLQTSLSGIQLAVDEALKINKPTKARQKYYPALLQLIYNKLIWEKLPFDEMQDIPSSYFRKVIGTHYKKYLDELVKIGAIERNDSYSTTYKLSKSYRLNQDIAYSDLILVEIKNNNEKKFNLKDPIIKKTIRNLQRIKTAYKTIEELSLIHI